MVIYIYTSYLQIPAASRVYKDWFRLCVLVRKQRVKFVVTLFHSNAAEDGKNMHAQGPSA